MFSRTVLNYSARMYACLSLNVARCSVSGDTNADKYRRICAVNMMGMDKCSKGVKTKN
jgi:hypothetical protein